LVAALIDVISKGEREGSLFYQVLRWGAHSEELLDAYSAVKVEKSAINPNYTIDAAIARIEGVMVREYEKGGTAASIKAALDRAIDQVQRGTGGHRGRMEDAIIRASQKLGGKSKEVAQLPAIKTNTGCDAIRTRPMKETDAETVSDLAGELGYPNELENVRQRIEMIGTRDLLLVAVDSTDKAVGFIQAHPVCIIEVGFRVEILGLVVSKTARRLGIGRRLIAEVEGWAKNAGAEAVVVRSNTKRSESHVFYPAMGYKAVKTQAVYEKMV
jgi:GNAT superfamily N-acetyltransferase